MVKYLNEYIPKLGYINTCEGSSNYSSQEVSLLCGILIEKLPEGRNSERANLEVTYKALFGLSETYKNDFDLREEEREKPLNLENYIDSYKKYALFPVLSKIQKQFIYDVFSKAFILEKYPSHLINIKLLETGQRSGSTTWHVLTACINATMLAFLDANLPMNYMVCAILNFDDVKNACCLVYNNLNQAPISYLAQSESNIKMIDIHNSYPNSDADKTFRKFKTIIKEKHQKCFGDNK